MRCCGCFRPSPTRSETPESKSERRKAKSKKAGPDVVAGAAGLPGVTPDQVVVEVVPLPSKSQVQSHSNDNSATSSSQQRQLSATSIGTADEDNESIAPLPGQNPHVVHSIFHVDQKHATECRPDAEPGATAATQAGGYSSRGSARMYTLNTADSVTSLASTASDRTAHSPVLSTDASTVSNQFSPHSMHGHPQLPPGAGTPMAVAVNPKGVSPPWAPPSGTLPEIYEEAFPAPMATWPGRKFQRPMIGLPAPTRPTILNNPNVNTTTHATPTPAASAYIIANTMSASSTPQTAAEAAAAPSQQPPQPPQAIVQPAPSALAVPVPSPVQAPSPLQPQQAAPPAPPGAQVSSPPADQPYAAGTVVAQTFAADAVAATPDARDAAVVPSVEGPTPMDFSQNAVAVPTSKQGGYELPAPLQVPLQVEVADAAAYAMSALHEPQQSSPAAGLVVPHLDRFPLFSAVVASQVSSITGMEGQAGMPSTQQQQQQQEMQLPQDSGSSTTTTTSSLQLPQLQPDMASENQRDTASPQPVRDRAQDQDQPRQLQEQKEQVQVQVQKEQQQQEQQQEQEQVQKEQQEQQLVQKEQQQLQQLAHAPSLVTYVLDVPQGMPAAVTGDFQSADIMQPAAPSQATDPMLAQAAPLQHIRACSKDSSSAVLGVTPVLEEVQEEEQHAVQAWQQEQQHQQQPDLGPASGSKLKQQHYQQFQQFQQQRDFVDPLACKLPLLPPLSSPITMYHQQAAAGAAGAAGAAATSSSGLGSGSRPSKHASPGASPAGSKAPTPTRQSSHGSHTSAGSHASHPMTTPSSTDLISNSRLLALSPKTIARENVQASHKGGPVGNEWYMQQLGYSQAGGPGQQNESTPGRRASASVAGFGAPGGAASGGGSRRAGAGSSGRPGVLGMGPVSTSATAGNPFFSPALSKTYASASTRRALHGVLSRSSNMSSASSDKKVANIDFRPKWR